MNTRIQINKMKPDVDGKRNYRLLVTVEGGFPLSMRKIVDIICPEEDLYLTQRAIQLVIDTGRANVSRNSETPQQYEAIIEPPESTEPSMDDLYQILARIETKLELQNLQPQMVRLQTAVNQIATRYNSDGLERDTDREDRQATQRGQEMGFNQAVDLLQYYRTTIRPIDSEDLADRVAAHERIGHILDCIAYLQTHRGSGRPTGK